MSLLSWLTTRSQTGTNAKTSPAAPNAAPLPAAAYPAVDPGIPAVTATALLEANAELLGRIKLAYGCDAATFEHDILGVARRFADYVNVLPATANNYFKEPGGLFRMGLEIGFYALQGTDAQIFEGRATISSRIHLQPRWRLATFIAGLCGEIHQTLSHITVRDPGGAEWPAYLFSLSAWLESRNATHIFPKWNDTPQENRASGVFALPMLVEGNIMKYLAEGNSIVVPHMMASISGIATYREHNILDDLVRRATAVVIDDNLRASVDRYGRTVHGAHLERYLLDAMRRLAATHPRWQPNQSHSRVWFGQDGMYLVWPKALAEVAELLESEHLPGIPKSPETLLEILIDARVALPKDQRTATCMILPPGVQMPYEAIRLAEPAILLRSLNPRPEPLDVMLVIRNRQGTESGTASHPSQQPPQPRAHQQAPTVPPQEPDCAANAMAPSPLQREFSAAAVAAPVRFALRPPLRLPQSIANPLRAMVHQLNSDAQPGCRTLPFGLFIPVAELVRHQLDAAACHRALVEAGMLVRAPGRTDYTHTCEFAGEQANGIVLAPEYVAGLNPGTQPDAGG